MTGKKPYVEDPESDGSPTAVADEVLASVPFRNVERLLDVGGGHGAFLRHIGSAWPHLQLGLFDLPEVATTGAALLGEALGHTRVTAHPGNFFSDSIPQGYDMVSLIRILHDHDDVPAQALLANIRKSLAPGSRLLIAEPMARIPGAEAMGEAFFGLYLWAMGSGRPRSPTEIIEFPDLDPPVRMFFLEDPDGLRVEMIEDGG